MQQYRLGPNLRMASALELPMKSLAAAMFWLIELKTRSDTLLPEAGPPSRSARRSRVRWAIRARRAGRLDENYWNAVVFRPMDRWAHFVEQSVLPQAVS